MLGWDGGKNMIRADEYASWRRGSLHETSSRSYRDQRCFLRGEGTSERRMFDDFEDLLSAFNALMSGI
jgi:hypothetical protein